MLVLSMDCAEFNEESPCLGVFSPREAEATVEGVGDAANRAIGSNSGIGAWKGLIQLHGAELSLP